MKPRIYYTKPSITELEVGYATDAARNGWGERCYDYLHRFEAQFREHLDVPFAIATSSCTGALHMGMAALGIGHGDEVILADTNWIASVSPVVHLGATPVFVDILEDSWCLDPAQVERAITPRTKAILAVHLYGNLCELDALLAIGGRHGIPVIEDAAEAIGSMWHGQRAGSLGRFGAFSFHGTKTLTTGEGGMFVTKDAALYETLLTLSNHGRARGQKRQFWPDLVGYKYKMSNVQAAIGCGQMERIGALIERKRAILQRYKQLLAPCGAAVAMNPEPEGTVNGAWMPTAVFAPESGVSRERLQAAFSAESIDARVFFYPLTALPMFGSRTGAPRAADIASRAINLPSFHDMTDDEQLRVVDVIRGVLNAEQLYAIWGSAGHAKVLARLIGLRGGRVVALFDNRDVASALPGVPIHVGVAGFERWADATHGLSGVIGLVAIGGSRGRDRLAIHERFRARGLRLATIVHPDASVCSSATLGEGTQVLAQAVVAADARVGQACIVNHRASVDHECLLGDGVHLAPGATLCGLVTIADNVMVGAGAVVLPRLSVGENSIVGAGAVVTRDVPPNVVVVGNPARCV